MNFLNVRREIPMWLVRVAVSDAITYENVLCERESIFLQLGMSTEASNFSESLEDFRGIYIERSQGIEFLIILIIYWLINEDMKCFQNFVGKSLWIFIKNLFHAPTLTYLEILIRVQKKFIDGLGHFFAFSDDTPYSFLNNRLNILLVV